MYTSSKRRRVLRCATALLMVVIIGCSESLENQFLSAVTRGDQASVERILNEGHVDVNYRTHRMGETALGIASGTGDSRVVKSLLERGADPNVGTTDGQTPLLRAAHDGSTEVIRLLIKAGASIDAAESSFGYTPLAEAARNGHLEAVRLLVEAGADKYMRTHVGKSPLQLARDRGYDQVVSILADNDQKP